jgi:hypothetical protein
MDKDNTISEHHQKCKGKKQYGASGGAYGLGFIGAAVYFIQHADTLRAGILGFLKALIWPAMVVYYLLDFLKI